MYFRDTNIDQEFKKKNNNQPLFIKLLIIGIILFLVVSVIFFFNKFKLSSNSKIYLVLEGPTDIILYQDNDYLEYGYKAYDDNGNDLTNKVIINNDVNSTITGEYTVTYQLGDIVKQRTVTIVSKNDQVTYLILKGSSTIYLQVGDEYVEPGYDILDTTNYISNDQIKITGSVDINKAGTYKLIYSFTKNDGIIISAERTVIVTNTSIFLNYNPTNITNKSVAINIKVNDNYFDYLLLPDNTKVTNREFTYVVNNNGSYQFTVYSKNGSFKTETVTINNIDKIKPSATCTAKSYSNQTIAQVNASDNIGISKYVYDNSYTSTSNKYTISKQVNDLNVQIYDKAGNVTDVRCSMSKSLIEMHFIPGVSDDDAIIIRTEDKTIMIDGGRWDAKDTIIAYLKTIGVVKIDALIGSHVHWNHVQSHAAILDNFEVENLYYPVDILKCRSLKQCESNDVRYIKDKIKELNMNPITLKPKDKITIGEMEIYVLGPVKEKLTTWQNANSSVFILKFGDKKFMFTGDTPNEYMDTSKFLDNASTFNMDIDIDVLKWPHHGYSGSELTNDFFEATTPEYAIVPRYFCSGEWPRGTTKEQLTKYNVTHYEVCKGQNVVLVSDGKSITIKTNQPPENYKR